MTTGLVCVRCVLGSRHELSLPTLGGSLHDPLRGPVVDARCLGGGVNHERGDDPMKIRRGRRVKWFMCCGAVCVQLHIQPTTRQPAPY